MQQHAAGIAPQTFFTNATEIVNFTPYMDKFWSVATFPIGVLICFGPAIVAWLIEEFKTPPPEKDEQRK
jgi:hypothetical protein